MLVFSRSRAPSVKRRDISLQLNTPLALAATHVLNDFACGAASLDEWLKRRARSNPLSGASRAFVVTDKGRHVHTYCAVAAGAVVHQAGTCSRRHNVLNPVPPVRGLARLPVDHRAQSIKLGDAARRQLPGPVVLPQQ